MKRIVLFLLILACHASQVLQAQTSFDVAGIDAGPLSYVTPGTYPVQVTVKNLNNDYYVDAMQASWQLDGGAIHTCTITQYLIYGNYLYPSFVDRFTHADSVTLPSTGVFTLKAWTSMPGNLPDLNPSNDTVSIAIHVMDSLPEKKLVMYYGTHTHCFPCGSYGEPQLDAILDSFPSEVYTITAHDGFADPFNNDDAKAVNDTYIWPFTGHPAFVYDQFQFPFFTTIIPYTFTEEWKGGRWRLDYRSPVEVKLKNVVMDTVTRMISGEVHTRFYADYSADLTVNVAIVEDSIYYAQDGVPGGSIFHRIVLRDLTDGLHGVSGIIPLNALAGEEFVYQFQDSVSNNVNVQQVSAVAYVQKNDADDLKREILNADEVRITDFSFPSAADFTTGGNEFSIHVFPNPAKDILEISSSAINLNGEYSLANMLGEIILKGTVNGNRIKISLKGVPPGGYYLRMKSELFASPTIKVMVGK